MPHAAARRRRRKPRTSTAREATRRDNSIVEKGRRRLNEFRPGLVSADTRRARRSGAPLHPFPLTSWPVRAWSRRAAAAPEQLGGTRDAAHPRVAAQDLRQVERECRPRQNHVGAGVLGLHFQFALNV